MNLNTKATAQNTYDAIVIGSGLSGGWAAKELTEKGLTVLMIERGHQLEHIKGYKTALEKPWEFQHRGRITEKQRKSHEFLSRDYPYSEHNASYWFRDADAPYEEKQKFDWYRPDIVGGKSIMWGRQSYRWSDLDFGANARDGHGTDWPVRYKEIEPWYAYVETFAGISGQKEGYGPLPDSVFMPPMEMNCVERQVKTGIESNFKNRIMTIGRTANITVKHHGRGPCQYRNLCSRGCPFGAYFSTQSTTLPPAMATGRLTMLTDSIVSEVMYDKEKGRATGVRIIDANSKQTSEYFSHLLFVNASTVGTAFILLNSTSDRFPDGLGNDSGVLGRYLMDHHFRCGASGEAPGFEDKYYYGRRANGIYVPRFRNVDQSEKRDYVRGFGYQGGASRTGWQRGIAEMGVGKDFKEMLSQPGMWQMGLGGFGECLPYKDNRVYLDRDKRDKWGLPTVVFDAGFKENEHRMRKDMINDAAEMLDAAGVKNINTFDSGSTPGQAIHEMGTARMGKDPKSSVLNKWNQMHAVKNVFVTDGSFMCSTACQNPSLTFMAMTARACDYAVKEMKKMNI
ncbi:MAG TPA: GMC family oxidoreductase [Chitinophagaceae bacterium]|jgi:choline dehydrogenase-like flavoprotein|nr:GMC family oxidoreductase [Chitinophagaceae bacterium]